VPISAVASLPGEATSLCNGNALKIYVIIKIAPVAGKTNSKMRGDEPVPDDIELVPFLS
jgi:hypothetical protein